MNQMDYKLEINDKIYIEGHKGLLGSAFLRVFEKLGYKNLIYEKKINLDLTNQQETLNFIKFHQPQVIIMAAGSTGGIQQNKNFPYKLLSENMLIQSNIFNAIDKINFKKLLFFGSSCMYPVITNRAINECDILSGKIEETSQAYGISKLSGYGQCQSYNNQFNNKKCITVIPNSMYGPNDNFDPVVVMFQLHSFVNFITHQSMKTKLLSYGVMGHH